MVELAQYVAPKKIDLIALQHFEPYHIKYHIYTMVYVTTILPLLTQISLVFGLVFLKYFWGKAMKIVELGCRYGYIITQLQWSWNAYGHN